MDRIGRLKRRIAETEREAADARAQLDRELLRARRDAERRAAREEQAERRRRTRRCIVVGALIFAELEEVGRGPFRDAVLGVLHRRLAARDRAFLAAVLPELAGRPSDPSAVPVPARSRGARA